METHRLDTETQIFFYENEFYGLSNFSAFRLLWKGIDFDTSEAAYHWEKFVGKPDIQEKIVKARSAHDAFRIARSHWDDMLENWHDIKADIMLEIIREKVAQHEYIQKKLLSSGDRELIEDSWRDPYWGWGPDKDGKNVLGNIWMKVREELRSKE